MPVICLQNLIVLIKCIINFFFKITDSSRVFDRLES